MYSDFTHVQIGIMQYGASHPLGFHLEGVYYVPITTATHSFKVNDRPDLEQILDNVQGEVLETRLSDNYMSRYIANQGPHLISTQYSDNEEPMVVLSVTSIGGADAPRPMMEGLASALEEFVIEDNRATLLWGSKYAESQGEEFASHYWKKDTNLN